MVGPLSVDDHVRETCVGPTSTNCTTGFVGAPGMSPGSVAVTELLDLELLPARSLAATRNV
jgi:hypothetical protein